MPEYAPGRASPSLRVVSDLRHKEEISSNNDYHSVSTSVSGSELSDLVYCYLYNSPMKGGTHSHFTGGEAEAQRCVRASGCPVESE